MDARSLTELGRVRLTSPDASCDGAAGDHLAIPRSRRGLEAIEDRVVLFRVAAR